VDKLHSKADIYDNEKDKWKVLLTNEMKVFLINIFCHGLGAKLSGIYEYPARFKPAIVSNFLRQHDNTLHIKEFRNK
jgi:hypothetical protein